MFFDCMLPSPPLFADLPRGICKLHSYARPWGGCLEQCTSPFTGGAVQEGCFLSCPCLISDVFFLSSPIPRGKCHSESARLAYKTGLDAQQVGTGQIDAQIRGRTKQTPPALSCLVNKAGLDPPCHPQAEWSNISSVHATKVSYLPKRELPFPVLLTLHLPFNHPIGKTAGNVIGKGARSGLGQS